MLKYLVSQKNKLAKDFLSELNVYKLMTIYLLPGVLHFFSFGILFSLLFLSDTQSPPNSINITVGT